MSTMELNLNIECPICNKKGTIKIPELILKKKKFGILKIQVSPGTICEDLFIVFLTTKGEVMGYEKIEPNLIKLLQKLETSYLIKIIEKYSLYGILCLVHAKFFNYPIYIVNSENILKEEKKLNMFFEKMFNKKLFDEPVINFISNNHNYGELKKKESLFLNAQLKNLYIPWTETLKFEKELFMISLNNDSEEEQIKILNNEFKYFIESVKKTLKLLKDKKIIYTSELLNYISSSLTMIKQDILYINLIKLFIKRRFSEKIANRIINRVEELIL